MMDVVRTTMLAALASAAIVAPSVAVADPPAAEPPHAPPVFQGAPTTQGGAFTLNFNDLGHFEGVGRGPEPPRNSDLTPGRERRQAGSLASPANNAATDQVFLEFLRQLRNVDKSGSRTP